VGVVPLVVRVVPLLVRVLLLVRLRVLRVLGLLRLVLHVCLHAREQPLRLRAELLLLGDSCPGCFHFLLPVGDHLKQPLVAAQARVQNTAHQVLAAVAAHASHTTASVAAAAVRVSEQKQGGLKRPAAARAPAIAAKVAAAAAAVAIVSGPTVGRWHFEERVLRAWVGLRA